MQHLDLLAIAQDAAKRAGHAILEIYDSGDFEEEQSYLLNYNLAHLSKL